MIELKVTKDVPHCQEYDDDGDIGDYLIDNEFGVTAEYQIPEEANVMSVLNAVYSALVLESYHPKSIIKAMYGIAKQIASDNRWEIVWDEDQCDWDVVDKR